MRGQGEEPGLLLRQRVSDRARGIAGDPPGVRHHVAPPVELRVQVLHVPEGPRREEPLPQVADCAFDAPLLVGRRHGAEPGDEVVVAAQLQEARVEADGVALPLQDGAFQVVVEQDPGHTPQGPEGLDVAAQEALERLVHGEDRMERPRPAQDQHERGQAPGGPAERDRPEAAPVDLGLLPDQEVQPQVGLGGGDRPQGPDHPAQLHDGAGVPPRLDHLEQPRGPEPGVLLERRLEERAVRVAQTGPDDGRPSEALGRQRPADRVGVQGELGGDGPHAPVLGEEEPADLGDLRRGDHARPPAASLPRRTGGPGGAPAEAVLVPPDEPAPAAARPTTGSGILGRRIRDGRLPWLLCIAASCPAGKADRHRRERGRQENAAGRGLLGRVMRHARLAPGPVGPLAVAMIEAPLGALLVAAAGGAETAGAPFPAARGAAVGVAAIT